MSKAVEKLVQLGADVNGQDGKFCYYIYFVKHQNIKNPQNI
jgi:hypothetical protein